jgi:outer membrane lipoprotein LolB
MLGERLLLLFLVSTALLLASCSTRPVSQAPAMDWQSRQARYATIDDWQLRARLGLRSANRSGSVTLLWEEQPQQRSIRLLNPMGGGLVSLQQDEHGARLEDNKRSTWQAATAGDAIYRATGWRIPIEQLRWWLLGVVTPGSENDYALDEQQRLASVRTEDWRLTIEDYRLFDDIELPARITVQSTPENDSEQPMQARIIVKSWQRGQQPAPAGGSGYRQP